MIPGDKVKLKAQSFYTMNAVNINNAIKNYKDVQALKGVGFEIKEGEFFGLLGPNGAGKTTLIQSIVGLCRLNKGDINVFGHDVVKNYRQARQLIGYSPQEVNLERYFTIKNTLQYQTGFFGFKRSVQKQRAKELLEQFGLSDKADVQFFRLSGGMQKRALIAKALVSRPKLLMLDEPTAGVDVKQRHDLWKYLKKLNSDGTTIILTTHYIDEADALCDRIGIINFGEIKEIGVPKDLIEKYCTPRICIKANRTIDAQTLAAINDFEIKVKDNIIEASGHRAGIMTQRILKIILEQPDVLVEDISVSKGSLEDVFLKVTGKSIEEIERNTNHPEKHQHRSGRDMKRAKEM